MEARGKQTPLFIKTYSKVRPRSTQKPARSPIFPADQPSFGSARKWINIPTGSPSVSEISEDSDQVDPPKDENSSEPESFVTIEHAVKKFGSKRLSSTPLVNIGNVLANKPRLSTFRRVASPYHQSKQGKRHVPQMTHMASIHESDSDSTTTDEPEFVHTSKQNRQRRSSLRDNASKQIAPHPKQSKRVGSPGFSCMMVKGNRVLPLGMPLASSTAINSGISQSSSQDCEDSSDYEVPTSEHSNGTVTEEMSSEEDDTLVAGEEEEDDDIEIMRDLPDSHVLSVQGKRVQMMPKLKQTPNIRKSDLIKLQLESLSLSNSSQRSRKQVSFLLSSRDKEAELLEFETRTEPVQLPYLPAKPSILKKTNSDSRDMSFSSTLVGCDEKKNRMSSTPTRAKTKKDKMMQLSFDVSSVHLPSYDISDLVVQGMPDAKQSSVPQRKEINKQIGFKVKSMVQDNVYASTVKQALIPQGKHSTHTGSTKAKGTAATQECKQITLLGPVTQANSVISQHEATALLEETISSASKVSPQQEDIMTQEDEVEGPTDNALMSHLQSMAESTPRSQLKRSSPESHLPFTPSKRKSRMKGPSHGMITVPAGMVYSPNHPQRKRLEYQDKATGPPECCITLIDETTCCSHGVEIIRYVSPHQTTYKKLQQMPTDVLEVLFG